MMHMKAAADRREIDPVRTFWCGCSLLALTCAASAARAQDAAPTTQAQAEAKQNGADVKPAQDTPATEIVVTGQRAAIDTAIQNKRRADQIIDSIAADDIGKLPDRSVTEALQRVAGVTIDHFIARNDPDHFSVEGSGVNIRGLTFVRSELNGRDSFTANGGRSISFEDVPPELLSGVDVYKNPSAELIEGGIGGLVNLRTRMPFDAKGFVGSVSVQGTEGDLRKKKEPSVSGLIGDRFDTGIGEIGFLVDVAYSKSATRTDGIQAETYYPRTSTEVVQEGVNADGSPNMVTNPLGLDAGQVVYIPKGFDWRTLDFTRKRFGAYGALQWKPASNLEFYATYFQSRYRMDWAEDAIFSQTNAYNVVPAAGTSFQYDDDGAFVKGTETDLNPTDGGMPFNDDVRAANRRSRTTDISGGMKWSVTPHFSLRLDVQHVAATTDSFDSTVATGVNLPSQDVDLTGHKPTIHVDQSYLADADNYYWAFTMDHLEHDTGKEWAYRADADYTFDNSFLKSIRVGFRGTDRDANNKSSPYNWQAVSQTWQLGWYIPRLAYLSEFPLSSETHNFGNFFHGKSDVPTQVVFPSVSQATGYPDSYIALHKITDTLCNCNSGFALAAYGDAQTNNQTEKTYAGYAMVRFGLDDISNIPLTGNIGLRVVHTRSRGAGFIVEPQPLTIPPPDPNGPVIDPGDYPVFTGASIPVTGGRSYTNWLPSLNLLYKFTPKLQARFAASKAVTRPDFSLLQAYKQLSAGIDASTGDLNLSASSLANPNLKPTKADQLDGALEWYFGTASSLTATVFYKKLHDIVRDTLVQETYFDNTYNVTEPNNVGSGKVKGIEVNYNQAFTFLPGLLSGLGINSNFTYVDSSSKVNSNLGAGTTSYLNVNGVDTNGHPFGHLPIEGLSKYSYNVAGYYEKGIISARLAYNWRSKYLLAVNVNGTQGSDGLYLDGNSIDCGNVGDHCEVFGLPTYNDSYGQLDGSIFLKLWNDRLSLGLEAQNLANAENRVLMQQSTIGMRKRAWFVSDRRYTLSARVTF